MIKAIFGVICIFCVVVGYSCCRIAGKSDETMEELRRKRGD